MPFKSPFGPRRLLRGLMRLPAWAFIVIVLVGLAVAVGAAMARYE